MASRNALLRYLRISVTPPTLRSSSIASHHRGVAPLYVILGRRFSEEVRGSFLDKSEVTDRVVSVVKNFQKVEPSKVFANLSSSTTADLETHLVWFLIGMIDLLNFSGLWIFALLYSPNLCSFVLFCFSLYVDKNLMKHIYVSLIWLDT